MPLRVSRLPFYLRMSDIKDVGIDGILRRHNTDSIDEVVRQAVEELSDREDDIDLTCGQRIEDVVITDEDDEHSPDNKPSCSRQRTGGSKKKLFQSSEKKLWKELANAETESDDSRECSITFQEQASKQAENIDGPTSCSSKRRRTICSANEEFNDDSQFIEYSEQSSVSGDDDSNECCSGGDPVESSPLAEHVGGGENSTAATSSGSNSISYCEPWASILAKLYKHRLRPYLVHDTVQYSDYEDRDRLVECFCSKDRAATAYTNTKFEQPFYTVVDRDIEGFRHLHILHDCQLSSRRCTCSRFSWYKRSNSFRRPTRTSQMSSQDWVAIFAYLCARPRRVLQVPVGRHLWRSPPRFTCISDEGDRTGRGEELVAMFFDSWTYCRIEPAFRSTTGPSICSTSTTYPGNTSKLRRGRGNTSDPNATVEEIIRLIKETASAPLEKVFEIDVWMGNSKFMMLRPSDRIVFSI